MSTPPPRLAQPRMRGARKHRVQHTADFGGSDACERCDQHVEAVQTFKAPFGAPSEHQQKSTVRRPASTSDSSGSATTCIRRRETAGGRWISSLLTHRQGRSWLHCKQGELFKQLLVMDSTSTPWRASAEARPRPRPPAQHCPPLPRHFPQLPPRRRL